MIDSETPLPPESSPEVPKRFWGPWATAGFGLAVGFSWAIIQTLVVVIFVAIRFASEPTPNFSLFENAFASEEGLLVSIATIAGAIVAVGLIMAIIKLKREFSIAEYLGLRSISKKTVLILLAVAAVLAVFYDVLSLIIGRPPDPQFMVGIYNTSVWPALLWISVVLFAPLFEETLFRGFLFEGFLQSRIGVTGTIGLTALAWTSLHALQYAPFDLATIFVTGIVFGIVRFKTKSLWSTMAMHAFMNLWATFELVINLNTLVK